MLKHLLAIAALAAPLALASPTAAQAGGRCHVQFVYSNLRATGPEVTVWHEECGPGYYELMSYTTHSRTRPASQPWDFFQGYTSRRGPWIVQLPPVGFWRVAFKHDDPQRLIKAQFGGPGFSE